MNSSLRMIVCGGGTGGHFYPALAIIEGLKAKGIQIKYVGSKYGIESDYYEKNNKDITLLNISGIQRSFNLRSLNLNFRFPWRFFCSYYKSFQLINKFKPHVVIGTGGYSSGIPLLVAINLGIKTVMQEQNALPGITNKNLSKYAIRCWLIYQFGKR